MDMRPGQGPLMPTLAPPPGLGLPPGPLGLPHPGLGHPGYPGPDLSGVRAQSVPSSPSPGRPAPGVLGPSPPSSSMSTFAAALRDLAKNAGEEPGPRKVNTPGPPSGAIGPVTSSLLDVRKGFGRTTPAETRSTPTPFAPATESPRPVSRSSAPPTSLTPAPPTSTFSGFQPYPGRPAPHPLGLHQPPQSPFPGAAPPGYHPALMQGMPGLYPGPEADPLYQAQMARYAAAAASSLGLPPGVHLPPAGPHMYPGAGGPGGVLPPSLLASYPPELLQAYGLMGHFHPTSTAAVEMARLHAKLRSDERLEMEARKEADRREMIKARDRERERSSPASGAAVKKSSSDALLKLSKIASHQPDILMQRLQPPVSQSCKNEIQSNLAGAGHKVPTIGERTAQSQSVSKSVKTNSIPSDIKLPTAPLDFSELSVKTPGSEAGPLPPCSPSDSVRSASPTPSSPSPTPDPNYTGTCSRCVPYVPKSRRSLAIKISDPDSSSTLDRASTPKKLFVRPFEDDYSPIQPPSGLGSAEEPLDISGSSLSPNKEGKQNGTNVDLDDIVKHCDDQDSDYESMSSDSSIKKEGSVLCPSSGHLLTDDEAVTQTPETKLGQFREPGDPENAVSRKDKLNYLRYFRLVTHRKKNDIEIEKLEKRRERLRERSPSPEPPAASQRSASPSLPLPSVAPHLSRLPETHAKAMYLSAIGLCRNSEEQKISNEIMWSVILDDRLTRETPDKQSVITKYFVKLRDLPDTAPESEARGVKRSRDGTFLAPASGPSSPVSPSLAPARYNGLNIPSSDAVSRLAGDGVTGSPAVTLPSSVEINLCSLQPIAKPTLLLQEVKTEPGDGSAPPPAPPAHLQPHMTFPRVLSSPFSEVKSEPEDLTVTKKKRTGQSPYSWPGVEAILESYKKFTAECELEKASLSERQARAQSEVTLRRGQVDTISTRLSSLARLHKTLVGNQAHTQASLETLRTQLVAISKFVNTSSK